MTIALIIIAFFHYMRANFSNKLDMQEKIFCLLEAIFVILCAILAK